MWFSKNAEFPTNGIRCFYLCAFGLPMGIFLVEGYVKTIPVSLEEAAAIDGSSFSNTLWRIILPITKPILVTVAIIQIFSCWNEFSFALVLIKNVYTADSTAGTDTV